MAASPTSAPQGAPGQGPGGPPPVNPAPSNVGAVTQLVSGLSQMAQMLGQIFPAASEEAQGIQQLVQQAQSKIAATSSPAQPAAPPI